MSQITRKERGWAGHFICADRCRFRRNTLVSSGRKHIVVSTVGAFFSTPETKRPEEIGCDRHYETMAFVSKRDDKVYHDIDVTKQVTLPAVTGLSITKANENKIDNLADAMHEDAVAEVMESFETLYRAAVKERA